MTTVTIQKFDFTLPNGLPFSEGHVCNANEAQALNQTFTENLRNNFAGKIKSAQEAAGEGGAIPHDVLETLRSEFATYAATYQFAQRTARAPADPVEAEARKLAKAAVTAALKARNVDLKSFGSEKIEEFTSKLLETKPEYREEAARRVAAIQETAGSVMDLLDGNEHVEAAADTAPKPKRKGKHAEGTESAA